jgi:hypothetical protein
MDSIDAMLASVRDEVAEADERALRADAQRLLDGMDPESQAGLWFDEFARAYSSRLEAAVAYVREGR